jgi:hypothetical protein
LGHASAQADDPEAHIREFPAGLPNPDSVERPCEDSDGQSMDIHR